MTIESLYDLNPGDAVAIKCYSYTWYKDVVLTTTERCIVTKSEPEMKFKKNNGFATRKEDVGCQISVITPEIQEQWDKLFYKDKLQDCLLDLEDSVSTDEVLTRVFNLLVSQTKWEQREQRTAIYDILLKLKHLSSDTLKQAVAILEEPHLPNN